MKKTGFSALNERYFVVNKDELSDIHPINTNQ